MNAATQSLLLQGPTGVLESLCDVPEGCEQAESASKKPKQSVSCCMNYELEPKQRSLRDVHCRGVRNGILKNLKPMIALGYHH